MSAPLAGRTILDCSALLPGPFIGKLLADRGARVIKIENPDRPDGARTMGSGLKYEYLNSEKELVLLNLTREEDRAKFAELVRSADGLIEGFRPRAKRKLGLDRESLHAINEKLCIVSLVGFPEDGPLRDRAGHDLNFEALTGALSMFDGLPGLPLADLFASMQGAFEMACALDRVARGAQTGERVVVSMTEALQTALGSFIHEYRKTGVSPSHGNTFITGTLPCYRIHTCADGRRVSVAGLEEKFWNTMCDILGIPDMKGKGHARGSEGDEVNETVARAFSSHPWSHWAPRFAAADCCVEPILDFSEVY